jgi:hypothetical protein
MCINTNYRQNYARFLYLSFLNTVEVQKYKVQNVVMPYSHCVDCEGKIYLTIQPTTQPTKQSINQPNINSN